MKLSFERPVFIGAHPDDNCMGCGALISRLKGSEFHCITFTCFDKERYVEWNNAMDYAQATSRRIFWFYGSTLPDHRYEIRAELERIKREIDPDVVFTHSLSSIHQSHLAVAEEVERIMRFRTVFGHAGVKSGPRFVPSFFIEITEKELEEKLKLLSFIEGESSKYFLQSDIIRAVARVNGAKIGVMYAEGFDVIRMVI